MRTYTYKYKPNGNITVYKVDNKYTVTPSVAKSKKKFRK